MRSTIHNARPADLQLPPPAGSIPYRLRSLALALARVGAEAFRSAPTLAAMTGVLIVGSARVVPAQTPVPLPVPTQAQLPAMHGEEDASHLTRAVFPPVRIGAQHRALDLRVDAEGALAIDLRYATKAGQLVAPPLEAGARWFLRTEQGTLQAQVTGCGASAELVILGADGLSPVGRIRRAGEHYFLEVGAWTLRSAGSLTTGLRELPFEVLMGDPARPDPVGPAVGLIFHATTAYSVRRLRTGGLDGQDIQAIESAAALLLPYMIWNPLPELTGPTAERAVGNLLARIRQTSHLSTELGSHCDPQP